VSETVTCAGCGKKFVAPDSPSGGDASCPECNTRTSVRSRSVPGQSPPALPPATEAGEWRISVAGEESGPYTISQMRFRLSTGKIPWTTHCWKPGMTEWRSASAFLELKGPPPGFSASPFRGYVGFWRRFCAAFIDDLLMLPAHIAVGLDVGITFPATDPDPYPIGAAIAFLAGLAVHWLYFSLMESSGKQATLGKLAMGIQVTDIAGGRISFGRASGRHFGKILSGMTLLIGYIMAAFTEKRQALHDMVAGCLVVNS